MAGISIYGEEEFCNKLQQNSGVLELFQRGEGLLIKEIKDIQLGKEILLKNNGSTINSWCRDGLPPDYVKDVIDDEDTNLILILSDSKDKIRGIALLSMDEMSMLLHVLCCNALPNVKTRQNVDYGSGGMLIKLIQFLGKDLEEGIKLYALETVITLYYKFGWRFVKKCGAKERKYVPEAVKNLFKYYKKNRFTRGDLETLELTGLLTAFRGSAKGRAELIRKGEKIKQEATKEARDDGYEMILCKETNVYNSKYSQDEEKKQSKGDGNKRKTKRKAKGKKKSKKTAKSSKGRPKRKTEKKYKKKAPRKKHFKNSTKKKALNN